MPTLITFSSDTLFIQNYWRAINILFELNAKCSVYWTGLWREERERMHKTLRGTKVDTSYSPTYSPWSNSCLWNVLPACRMCTNFQAILPHGLDPYLVLLYAQPAKEWGKKAAHTYIDLLRNDDDTNSIATAIRTKRIGWPAVLLVLLAYVKRSWILTLLFSNYSHLRARARVYVLLGTPFWNM